MDSSPILIHPQEEYITEKIEVLREKVLENQMNFPLPPRIDSAFLAKFLRGKKYDIDEALIGIHKYYNGIKSNLRILEGLKVEQCIDTYNLNAVKVLKHQYKNSNVICANVSKWDTKIASIRDLENSAVFVLEELLQIPQFQLHGGIGIADLAGLSFSHLKQINVIEIKHLITVALDMFPIRIAGLHIVNAPLIFWPIFKVIMKVLPTKLQKRVHIHSSFDSLVNSLDPAIFPKSLGGELEEDEAWDQSVILDLVKKNLCYDNYWNGSNILRPRRLSRKRSSSMMSS